MVEIIIKSICFLSMIFSCFMSASAIYYDHEIVPGVWFGIMALTFYCDLRRNEDE